MPETILDLVQTLVSNWNTELGKFEPEFEDSLPETMEELGFELFQYNYSQTP